MSQQAVTSNTITSAASNGKIPVERYYIKLQSPNLAGSLARFLKPRTTTSSSDTADKTVIIPPPPSSSVELTQTATPSNSDAKNNNDSGNGNKATIPSPSTINSDVASKTTNSIVSSTTSSAEDIAVTPIDSTTTISNSSSNLSDKIEITSSTNVSSERRSSGRPPVPGPTIRPALESLSRRSSGSPSSSISSAPKSHLPSWASFWSAKYHEKADALNSGNKDSSSRASQDSLPVSETTITRHPGTKFDKSNSFNAIGDSNIDQKSRKPTSSKFSLFCQRLRSLRPTNKSAQAGPTPKLWDTVYDGSEYNLLEDSDDEYNPFAFNLPLSISTDKSELDYLRRTQMEECLEWDKRRLFCTKENPTRYVIMPINIYY